MNRHHKTKKRCAGQAMIEFCIGLLALLLLVTGIIHVGNMARHSLALHGEIRAEAGMSAMGNDFGVAPEAISDWDSGPDNLSFTADDKARVNATASMSIMATVVEHSAQSGDDWQVLADKTQLRTSMAQLQRQMTLSMFLGSVHKSEKVTMKVDPFIRDILNIEQVTIKEEIWMPLMGGLF